MKRFFAILLTLAASGLASAFQEPAPTILSAEKAYAARPRAQA